MITWSPRELSQVEVGQVNDTVHLRRFWAVLQRRQSGNFYVRVDLLCQEPDHILWRDRLQQSAHVKPGKRHYYHRRALFVVAGKAAWNVVDQHLGRSPSVVLVDRPLFTPFHRLRTQHVHNSLSSLCGRITLVSIPV